MKYYDRKSGNYIEVSEPGQGSLKFLYKNPLGRMVLKIVINPAISRIYGAYNNSALSKRKIESFISTNKINMKDFEKRDFNSFNDFFTRKLAEGAREINMGKENFVSPCDSKLLAYKITDDLKVDIKDSTYTLKELTGGKVDVSSFNNGWCLIFRLCVDDYHRYIYLDDGELTDTYDISGKLHTVRSIASDYKIYKENSRTVSVLDTENFGEVIQIEVGAMFIGKISNNNQRVFKRGDEKGFFEFGGSTIAVLVQDKRVNIDEDILYNSKNDVESIVKCGEMIGRKL